MPIGQFREEWRVRRGITQLSTAGGSVLAQTYFQRLKNLFGTSLIAYWPMSESSGTVSVDYSGNNYNGTYTAVTLGQAGIGDNLTSGSWDGSTSYMQPGSGFLSAINGQLGSILFWVAPTGWTVLGDAFQFFLNGSNLIRCSQNSSGATDRFEFNYIAGGTTKATSESSGQTYTTFQHFVLTWSLSADQFITYKNGAQLGSTQTGLGTFAAGAFTANQTLVGARITTPTNTLSGRISHFAVLDRVASLPEVNNVSSV